jgi:polar amino acid transport system substrate-binding protein
VRLLSSVREGATAFIEEGFAVMMNTFSCFRAAVGIIVFVCIFWLVPAAGAEEGGAGQGKKKIVLGSDLWCPYNCEPGSALPGYVVEMARAIFEKRGYEVEYTMIEYEQAMTDALRGRITAVIGLDRREGEKVEKQEDPSGSLKFQYPRSSIGRSASHLFVVKANSWRFNPDNPDASLAELGGKVGIVKGYACDLREKLLAANMLVEVGGTEPLNVLLARLREGRIKAVIDDRNVIMYAAGRLGWALMIHEAGIAEEATDLNLAFCAECKNEADIFDQGLAELRASGELEKILLKYAIRDWTAK